jgi:NAD(P)-dependent dehydrogenase (short-subunit alcohol dehydrogenase family)
VSTNAPPPTVLVTGAARRLGREMALGLAAAGWQVAVHYRGSADEARQTVADCTAAAAGCAASRSRPTWPTKRPRAAWCRGWSPNWARSTPWSTAPRCSSTTRSRASRTRLQEHLLANTAAPIVLAQSLHQHLEARGAEGVVVNLLDQKLWNPNPDFLSYTLSKAALEAATTLLAQALAPTAARGRRRPGLTITSHLLSQEKFEQLHKLSPLGRSSTPQDVVAAVRFALENRSITGTTILVDGGQHLMKFDRDFSLM